MMKSPSEAFLSFYVILPLSPCLRLWLGFVCLGFRSSGLFYNQKEIHWKISESIKLLQPNKDILITQLLSSLSFR